MIKIKNYNIYKMLIYIGLPVALENLVYSFINFIDNFMVGKNIPELGLGTNAVSALGISNQIFFVFIISLFGLFSGAGVLSAQYYGVKDYKNLKKILGFLIVGSLVFSIPFIIVGLFFTKDFLSIYTKDLEVLKQAVRYFRISIFTFPIAGIGFALSMQLRVLGQSKYAFYSALIGLFLNIVGNSVLIPISGVSGAAVSTVIARLISTIYMIYIIKKNKFDILGKIKDMLDIDINLIKKIMIISMPTFIHEILWVMGTNVRTMLYSSVGSVEFAAIITASTISSTLFSMFSGVSNAAAVTIGKNLGANELEKADLTSNIALKLMVFLGVLAGIILVIISPIILYFMQVDADLYKLTLSVLNVESLLLILKGCNLLLIVGILRSGGDIYMPMIIDLIGIWVVSIPLTYLGKNLMLPISLIYFLAMLEEVAKFIPSYFRYRKKKWLKKII